MKIKRDRSKIKLYTVSVPISVLSLKHKISPFLKKGKQKLNTTLLFKPQNTILQCPFSLNSTPYGSNFKKHLQQKREEKTTLHPIIVTKLVNEVSWIIIFMFCMTIGSFNLATLWHQITWHLGDELCHLCALHWVAQSCFRPSSHSDVISLKKLWIPWHNILT